MPLTLIYRLAVVLGAGVVVLYHSNSVILHFENGPYFFDSGWFAYLLETGGPGLENPPYLPERSFYDYHLSPILVVWGALTSGLFGVNGITALALLSAAAGLAGMAGFVLMGPGRRWLALGLGLLYALGNEPVMRALGYPHVEILFAGLPPLMFACLWRGGVLAAILPALLLILTREDGGFFAAFTVLAFLTMNRAALDRRAIWRGVALFAACFAAAVGTMALKRARPGEVDLFHLHFAGDGFSHVIPDLLVARLWSLTQEAGTGPYLWLLVLFSLLAVTRWRVLDLRRLWAPPLLMAPLLLLYLAASNDTLARFRLYYALPWAILIALTVQQGLARLAEGRGGRGTVVGLLALLVLTSVPAGTYLRTSSDVRRWAGLVTTWPQGTVPAMRAAMAAQAAAGRPCTSQVAMGLHPALFPRDRTFVPWELTGADGAERLARCTEVILFEGSLYYRDIARTLETQGWQGVPLTGRLRLYRPG
ncbi:hypothetical protein [Pseudooceanicola aestuarii]|uniref:hypothetical protein n=1 Tax=Pseudooceanicola aestuarii TaxID=2697319 RepID=UPI0013D52C98|nr:hypothetical protein [Pseudooceanicola aestuarii]